MVRMRWVPVVALLGGCYTPSVAEGLACTPNTHRCPADQQCDPRSNTCVADLEPPCTSFGAWAPARPLQFPMGYAAAMSPDGATLVFDVNDPSGDLYVATWDTSAGDYVNPQAIATLNTTADEVDAGWSADGTVLYFRSDGNPMSSTVTPGPAFGAPVPAIDLPSLGTVRRPRFSWDGLDVFYWDELKLYHAHRTSETAAWQDAADTVADLDDPMRDEREPAIDAEGLRIIYSLDDFMLREAIRADRQSAFGSPQPIELGTGSYFEPDLSRDGTRLLFTSAGSADRIFMMTRTCNLH